MTRRLTEWLQQVSIERKLQLLILLTSSIALF